MSDMIELKTAELSGAALDWAVAKAEISPMEMPPKDSIWGKYCSPYSPSTDWSQGGPLIEKYQLTVSSPLAAVHRNGGPNAGYGPSGLWSACTWFKGANGRRSIAHHETSALIAACRAIVASVLGETVSVPKELI